MIYIVTISIILNILQLIWHLIWLRDSRDGQVLSYYMDRENQYKDKIEELEEENLQLIKLGQQARAYVLQGKKTPTLKVLEQMRK